jgi:hypothetical protein
MPALVGTLLWSLSMLSLAQVWIGSSVGRNHPACGVNRLARTESDKLPIGLQRYSKKQSCTNHQEEGATTMAFRKFLAPAALAVCLIAAGLISPAEGHGRFGFNRGLVRPNLTAGVYTGAPYAYPPYYGPDYGGPYYSGYYAGRPYFRGYYGFRGRGGFARRFHGRRFRR